MSQQLVHRWLNVKIPPRMESGSKGTNAVREGLLKDSKRNNGLVSCSGQSADVKALHPAEINLSKNPGDDRNSTHTFIHQNILWHLVLQV